MISYLKSMIYGVKPRLVLVLSILIFSCQKNEVLFTDPYAGGKAPLGVEFISKTPMPALASPGDVVEVKINGLDKYTGKFKVYVNELEAEVVEFTNTLLRFRVPENASTGGLWITFNDPGTNLENQTYFGPGMQIAGKVAQDNTFAVVNGSNFSIFDALRLPSGNFVLGGAFTDYEKTATPTIAVGRLTQINTFAKIDNSLKFGLGSNGAIFSVARIASGDQNGKFLIAGYISSFNSKKSNRININGITRLNTDGTLDTTEVDVVNLTPNNPAKNKDTVPTFNGGVQNFEGIRGPLVRRVFSMNNMVYAVGNFDRHVKTFYERSTFDSKVLDATRIKQIVRMKPDGTMDSTYRFFSEPKSSNGSIADAIQLNDGSLVVVGDFTTFDGKTVNRIAKINPNGILDASFDTGTGANESISSITYNAATGHILVAGRFTQFNGQPLGGVALLNANGAIVNGFTFPQVGGGIVNFAGQMNNGKILVAGNFNRYRNVLRQGFMVINADGTLAAGYNNTGLFVGTVYDMLEVTSDAGFPAAILVGDISRFNNDVARNIIKVELQN